MYQLNKLINSQTFKDTQIVSLGTLINLAVGGIFFILTPRILGPQNYGLFSTVISTGTLAVIVANFGIDTGILKFAQGENAKYITSIAFKFYILLGILAAIFGLIFASPIAIFLGQPQISSLLRIAFASVILILLSNYFVAVLQAKKEFLKASIVSLSSNITRLLILLYFYFFAHLTLLAIVFIYFAVNIASLIFGFVFAPPKLDAKKTTEIKNFAFFNFWVATTIIIASIPLDHYFTLKFAGSTQAGIYAAPFKLLTAGYALGSAFSRVFAPRFSSFVDLAQVKAYSLKAVALVLPLISAFLVLILLAPAIVKIIFGANYLASVSVMRLQSIGFIFFTMAIIPGAIILYYFGKSKIAFLVSGATTALYAILLYKLVPQYQANGAAAAFAINEFLTFLLLCAFALYFLNRQKI